MSARICEATISTAHIEIWIPSWAPSHLVFDRLVTWSSNLQAHHLHTRNLCGISGYCLYGSPKYVINQSKPLIMIYNMKQHCELLSHIGVNSIFQQTPTPKRLPNKIKSGSSYSKHVDSLCIIAKVVRIVILSRIGTSMVGSQTVGS